MSALYSLINAHCAFIKEYSADTFRNNYFSLHSVHLSKNIVRTHFVIIIFLYISTPVSLHFVSTCTQVSGRGADIQGKIIGQVNPISHRHSSICYYHSNLIRRTVLRQVDIFSDQSMTREAERRV